jgi:hypothetical protein
MTFDVVVPTAGRPTLRALLKRLEGLPGPAPERIIVVRDGERRLGPAAARNRGWRQATADWVVFLDDDDAPYDGMLEALIAAQAAADADVVTGAVRPAEDLDAMQMFLGDPGALGLVENQYGVLGLVRGSLAAGQPSVDGAGDPDWLLFARLALAGARVVSIPEALSVHHGRPGTARDVPGAGPAVLEAFEAHDAAPLHDLPQLTATLAASLARLEAQQKTVSSTRRSALRRLLRRKRLD